MADQHAEQQPRRYRGHKAAQLQLQKRREEAFHVRIAEDRASSTAVGGDGPSASQRASMLQGPASVQGNARASVALKLRSRNQALTKGFEALWNRQVVQPKRKTLVMPTLSDAQRNRAFPQSLEAWSAKLDENTNRFAGTIGPSLDGYLSEEQWQDAMDAKMAARRQQEEERLAAVEAQVQAQRTRKSSIMRRVMNVEVDFFKYQTIDEDEEEGGEEQAEEYEKPMRKANRRRPQPPLPRSKPQQKKPAPARSKLAPQTPPTPPTIPAPVPPTAAFAPLITNALPRQSMAVSIVQAPPPAPAILAPVTSTYDSASRLSLLPAFGRAHQVHGGMAAMLHQARKSLFPSRMAGTPQDGAPRMAGTPQDGTPRKSYFPGPVTTGTYIPSKSIFFGASSASHSPGVRFQDTDIDPAHPLAPSRHAGSQSVNSAAAPAAPGSVNVLAPATATAMPGAADDYGGLAAAPAASSMPESELQPPASQYPQLLPYLVPATEADLERLYSSRPAADAVSPSQTAADAACPGQPAADAVSPSRQAWIAPAPHIPAVPAVSDSTAAALQPGHDSRHHSQGTAHSARQTLLHRAPEQPQQQRKAHPGVGILQLQLPAVGGQGGNRGPPGTGQAAGPQATGVSCSTLSARFSDSDGFHSPGVGLHGIGNVGGSLPCSPRHAISTPRFRNIARPCTSAAIVSSATVAPSRLAVLGSTQANRPPAADPPSPGSPTRTLRPWLQNHCNMPVGEAALEPVLQSSFTRACTSGSIQPSEPSPHPGSTPAAQYADVHRAQYAPDADMQVQEQWQLRPPQDALPWSWQSLTVVAERPGDLDLRSASNSPCPLAFSSTHTHPSSSHLDPRGARLSRSASPLSHAWPTGSPRSPSPQGFEDGHQVQGRAMTPLSPTASRGQSPPAPLLPHSAQGHAVSLPHPTQEQQEQVSLPVSGRATSAQGSVCSLASLERRPEEEWQEEEHGEAGQRGASPASHRTGLTDGTPGSAGGVASGVVDYTPTSSGGDGEAASWDSAAELRVPSGHDSATYPRAAAGQGSADDSTAADGDSASDSTPDLDAPACDDSAPQYQDSAPHHQDSALYLQDSADALGSPAACRDPSSDPASPAAVFACGTDTASEIGTRTQEELGAGEAQTAAVDTAGARASCTIDTSELWVDGGRCGADGDACQGVDESPVQAVATRCQRGGDDTDAGDIGGADEVCTAQETTSEHGSVSNDTGAGDTGGADEVCTAQETTSEHGSVSNDTGAGTDGNGAPGGDVCVAGAGSMAVEGGGSQPAPCDNESSAVMGVAGSSAGVEAAGDRSCVGHPQVSGVPGGVHGEQGADGWGMDRIDTEVGDGWGSQHFRDGLQRHRWRPETEKRALSNPDVEGCEGDTCGSGSSRYGSCTGSVEQALEDMQGAQEVDVVCVSEARPAGHGQQSDAQAVAAIAALGSHGTLHRLAGRSVGGQLATRPHAVLRTRPHAPLQPSRQHCTPSVGTAAASPTVRPLPMTAPANSTLTARTHPALSDPFPELKTGSVVRTAVTTPCPTALSCPATPCPRQQPVPRPLAGKENSALGSKPCVPGKLCRGRSPLLQHTMQHVHAYHSMSIFTDERSLVYAPRSLSPTGRRSPSPEE